MPRNNTFISPLLSSHAVDYARAFRGVLIYPHLFPIQMVSKPVSTYKTYTKEDIFNIPDTILGEEDGAANSVDSVGKKEGYVAEGHGLKKKIDEASNEVADEAFKEEEADAVEFVVDKLELAHEKRCAEKVNSLPSANSTTLTGSGTEEGHKWTVDGDETGGNPYTAFKNAIKKMAIRPNKVVIPLPVFDVLEDHPVLIAKLGELKLMKIVNEETLGKMFRIKEVVIADTLGDIGNKKADGAVNLKSLWGNTVIFSHTSEKKDAPCAGKTFVVKYKEAKGNGYVVQKDFIKDSGIKGATLVRVAHDICIKIVAPDCMHAIKDVL